MTSLYKKIQIQVTIILLGMTCFTATAQHEPQYTHYMYNTMLLNPGYTGSLGQLEAVLLHRSQWVGIDGAPQTQTFGIHDQVFDNKVGIGLSIVNDRIGPSSEQFFEGNFSYSIPLNYSAKLAFGLKAGARLLNVDWSRGRFYDPVDVLLNNNINGKLNPLIGAGVFIHDDKWYIGASIPNFIKSDYYDDLEEAVVTNELHYYLMGGYVFSLSESVLFKPAFLVKVVGGAPLSADISANFLLQEKLTLGASYRWDDSVSALAGLQISQSIFVGYSYDYTVTSFSKYNDGSHEIILRYQLPQRSQHIKSPRFF